MVLNLTPQLPSIDQILGIGRPFAPYDRSEMSMQPSSHGSNNPGAPTQGYTPMNGSQASNDRQHSPSESLTSGQRVPEHQLPENGSRSHSALQGRPAGAYQGRTRTIPAGSARGYPPSQTRYPARLKAMDMGRSLASFRRQRSLSPKTDFDRQMLKKLPIP